mmetsp:Transcript_18603/g.38909  ORF Transcript_18603/g.38909 Transcript_18603/m.38909 type:complete len:90 (+) Transcript_18603:1587-1856(+)
MAVSPSQNTPTTNLTIGGPSSPPWLCIQPTFSRLPTLLQLLKVPMTRPAWAWEASTAHKPVHTTYDNVHSPRTFKRAWLQLQTGPAISL